MNLFLIFGPLGAIIVEVLFIAAWKRRSNVSIKHFLLSRLIWNASPRRDVSTTFGEKL